MTIKNVDDQIYFYLLSRARDYYNQTNKKYLHATIGRMAKMREEKRAILRRSHKTKPVNKCECSKDSEKKETRKEGEKQGEFCFSGRLLA